MPRHDELNAHWILSWRLVVENAVEFGLLENPALDLGHLSPRNLHRFGQTVDHEASALCFTAAAEQNI